ncbi:MAG: DUF4115 domain-containing protein, partial [Elainellaceae cyanobacterium]
KVAASFLVNPQTQPLPSTWNASAAAQLRPLHLYAAYVALIVAAVSGVSYLLSALSPGTVTTQQQTAPTESAVVEGNGTEAPPSRSPEPEEVGEIGTAAIASEADPESPDQADATPDSPVEVSLELVERSWLRIVVDGNEEFEGVLQEGAEQTWTAENEVVVRAGNAGGVLLAVNKRPAEVMGQPGSVSEQTFSIDTPTTSGPTTSTQ